eukprot:TRINITY_DN454_c0_g1_i1.p1 TRINITY_DN454_c0_g1~~TRINITY_DN454_c0_g1_i1.p1  ORF type:complete len:312 (-),score=63.61 TRINITY_DN454_c0_g1_i1:155-1090(-)
MADILKKLLSETTVDSLPTSKGKVLSLEATDPVVKGFQILLDNKILSAPVYDKKENKYIGFLDIRDLVSFCVFLHDTNMQADNLLDIVNYGVKMFKHAVDGVTISYLSRRNPFHSVKHGTSMLQVVDLLAHGNRRVAVVDDNGVAVNIISQSSVLRFFQEHMNQLKSLLEVKIANCHIGTSPVITVSKETRAIDVFRLMDHHMRSGVAVTDSSGTLVGNTSGYDLKLFIQTPSVKVLQLPIMQFLNEIRSDNIDICTPVITCHTHDNLALLISKLVATKVHRVFIVEDDFKPLRVVSVVDILKHFSATHQL